MVIVRYATYIYMDTCTHTGFIRFIVFFFFRFRSRSLLHSLRIVGFRSFIFVYKYYSFSFHTEKLYFVAVAVAAVVVVGDNGGGGGDGGVALCGGKYEIRARKKNEIYTM